MKLNGFLKTSVIGRPAVPRPEADFVYDLPTPKLDGLLSPRCWPALVLDRRVSWRNIRVLIGFAETAPRLDLGSSLRHSIKPQRLQWHVVLLGRTCVQVPLRRALV